LSINTWWAGRNSKKRFIEFVLVKKKKIGTECLSGRNLKKRFIEFVLVKKGETECVCFLLPPGNFFGKMVDAPGNFKKFSFFIN
jgi:hypothetical protein